MAHHEVDQGHVTGGGSSLHHVIAEETDLDHVIADGRGLGHVIVVGIGIDRGRGGERIATPMIERRNHLNLKTSKSNCSLNYLECQPVFMKTTFVYHVNGIFGERYFGEITLYQCLWNLSLMV